MVALVCGLRTEGPTRMLIDALDAAHADYVVVNQPDIADQVRVRWQFGPGGLSGALLVGDEAFDVREIRSVFVRWMDTDRMPAARADRTVLMKTRSVIGALQELFDLLPARIVNRRWAMMSNFSKPYQCLQIREAGFAIPETLITNDAERARRFIRVHGHDVIYKSTSAERSMVQAVDEHDLKRLHEVAALPTQFQQRIHGTNVRVHVIGDTAFATECVSDRVDYRYAGTDADGTVLRPYQLPDSLARRCVDLTAALDLEFSGIDLIVAQEQIHCLEVNTAPGYSFYEAHTGQPISHCLAAHLTA